MRALLRGAVVAASLLVLAGCTGGGGDPQPTAAPTDTASSEPTAGNPLKRGEPAGDDLSEFECGDAGNGTWTASGVITSSAGDPADYRLTVTVAPAGVDRADGRRLVLPRLESDEPEPFRITDIRPTAGEEPVCRIQVVRLEPRA